ncbi:NAD-binding protein [Specibacter sp. NPDC078709]|uniref:NAD-binding protein n=1 Tax=Specibacter sp. NPDC078709 TaxID=3154364 RepID=UPI00342DD198
MTTPDNERLLRWFKAEVKRLRIAVKLNTVATVESIHTLNPDHVIVATYAVRPMPDFPGGDLPNVQTGVTLRAMMLGTATAQEAGAALSTFGKLGRLSGVTKSPEFVRQFTKYWLPMGKDVVVIGDSLVGLELAEFLAERSRRVTLLHDSQPLGLLLVMHRRWTAVKLPSMPRPTWWCTQRAPFTPRGTSAPNSKRIPD